MASKQYQQIIRGAGVPDLQRNYKKDKSIQRLPKWPQYFAFILALLKI